MSGECEGDVVIADVVSPMLTYRCPCDCHSNPVGQPQLFEEANA